MAKAKTKKSKQTKEEGKIEETSKAKNPKTVKLGFNPLFSARQSFSCYLVKKEDKNLNGKIVTISKPLIEGLPEIFEVQKGASETVTYEQYEQLKELGFIDSQATVQKRQAFEAEVKNQHPNKPSFKDDGEPVDESISSKQAHMLYSDKLIVLG